MSILNRKKISAAILLLMLSIVGAASGQSFMTDESARSDKLTGGTIERTRLIPGESDIKITVNVPAFQLTLWQNGKEVKTYWVGVGMKDYPIFIGPGEAKQVIWNPNWIPPDSDWVSGHKGVTAGEIIKPTDPRNPLGRLKIPLGGGYLIHQAKGVGDLGSLVSHGCVRMLKSDLYDLAEKIVAARSLPVTPKQIESAKKTLKTLSADLDPAIPVEITYDTQVVEAGRLHIYPDVYDQATNTIENLRDELKSNGVNTSHLTDKTLAQMLARAASKKQYVIGLKNLEMGALNSGQTIPVVAGTIETKTKSTNGGLRQRRVSR